MEEEESKLDDGKYQPKPVITVENQDIFRWNAEERGRIMEE